jgi:hypothetical protein
LTLRSLNEKTMREENRGMARWQQMEWRLCRALAVVGPQAAIQIAPGDRC